MAAKKKSFNDKVLDILEQSRQSVCEEDDDVKKEKEQEEKKKDEKDMEESSPEHKRPADKDQKEKEEVSKVKQEEKEEEKKDDEEDEEEVEEEKEEEKKEDEEDEEEEEDVKESASSHKRPADKDAKEKADKLDPAKGQDSKKEVSKDNKKAFDYTQTKPKVSVGEDIDALFNGEDLSEEFKEKATTILEAAVQRHLNEKLEEIEKSANEKFEELAEEQTQALIEQVSKYLDYIVEEWMEDNKLAVERGIAVECCQDFMSGLKSLFEEHYIEVPENPRNIVDELQSKTEELEKELNESLNKNVELKDALADKEKSEIFSDVSSDLAETEKEEFQKLSEDIEFSGTEEYRSKLSTIKTNYFPTEKKEVKEVGDLAGGGFEDAEAPSPTMQRYVSALSQTLAHKKK